MNQRQKVISIILAHGGRMQVSEIIPKADFNPASVSAVVSVLVSGQILEGSHAKGGYKILDMDKASRVLMEPVLTPMPRDADEVEAAEERKGHIATSLEDQYPDMEQRRERAAPPKPPKPPKEPKKVNDVKKINFREGLADAFIRDIPINHPPMVQTGLGPALASMCGSHHPPPPSIAREPAVPRFTFAVKSNGDTEIHEVARSLATVFHMDELAAFLRFVELTASVRTAASLADYREQSATGQTP